MFKEILIHPDTELNEAIESLDKAKQKILLVCNNKNKLLGTVTDGDIRRALIKSKSLSIKIKNIMNKNYIYCLASDDQKTIKNKLFNHSLKHIPILNKKKEIKGIKSIKDFYNNDQLDNYVIIMAGGFGKRLQPLTNNLPKPMIQINGIPVLEIILKRFIDQGFKNFIFTVFYKKDKIIKYFKNGKNWNVNIDYISEDMPLGTAGSLSMFKKNFFKKPVIVTNGDLLTKFDYRSLIENHILNKNKFTVCVKKFDLKVEYGVVKIEKNKIKKIDEKPVEQFFANAGIYLINPELINKLKKNLYLDMPSFINKLVKDNIKIDFFPMYESWIDIGQKAEYEKAKRTFLKN